MRNDIIEKLQRHLSGPIKTEPAVVYLLVEIRKILEQDYGSALKPPSLYMHCCWAIHVDLKGSNTTAHFLKRIESYVQNNVRGFTPDNSFTMRDEAHLFDDFIHMASFKRELREFLAGHDLPTNLCDAPQQWQEFLKSYSAVIQDGALTVSDGSLKTICKVVCTKSEAIPSMEQVPFMIRWCIHLMDGRLLTADLRNHANPDFDSYSLTLSQPAKAA